MVHDTYGSKATGNGMATGTSGSPDIVSEKKQDINGYRGTGKRLKVAGDGSPVIGNKEKSGLPRQAAFFAVGS